MNSYLKGLLCCLLATVSWGGMFPVMTHALTYIDPFNFTTFRYGIAGIAFALLLLFREGQNSFRLKGERWGLAWLFGTLGFAGFGFLVFLGQSLAGPGGALTASIMMATMPMLGLLTIWALKKVRPHASTMSFILLSFSGVVLVITNGDVFAVLNSPISLAANLLLIAGALCWVLYTIGGSYFPGWSPLRYTTMTTLLGMISVVLIDLFLVGSGAISVPSAASIITIVPHLLYMALVAGLVAVLCWNVGNRIITPTNGVLFMDVVPITAFIVSALNGVVPTNMQITGAVITAMALVLNNLNQRKLAILATQANTLKASTSH
ncbi:DMT family transporter [Salmonella enterica subsp. enterica serovar Tennessee]|uniref:Threonine/homoserine exporter RhtA n=5 Tax=Enterobacteriaceae TaxID=543 RepID=A0A5U7J3M0_SALER|nr:DMT family transporter [Salmonella enterica]ECE1062621.1 DMT family transporter [Salmonella enterica subsp. enterica]EDT2094009.1 DMT family transporter [Salmonella enterica subsp. enterica serovar Rissen]ATP97868.1 EamA/RhaT family transporter [Salmonella enterica subsp. enterica serovar Tennessee]AVV18892.1 EamA/RhaT family transporter [Salmonella enterica subsp. enterica serovar Tennessee]AVV23500.1 EamA/RhaT family transporter [Salmonella enterica subsp. enterica serovar Tennessee]